MKSKFTPIVKVKKQMMDRVETLLAKARYKEQNISKKLSFTCKQIEETKVPKEGSISLMLQFRENLKILRDEKSNLSRELEISQNEIKQLQDKYKRARMEYEKMKYLEKRDFEEWMKKIKKQEQLDLDEVSTMLFVNKG
ncbi:flagellar export protein FliJ [Sulfurospirillum sp. 1307]|jgi:flagellar export protein FliJ